MPSVTRCSLIEKRRRNTSPGMTSSPATFTFYSSPKAYYLGSWHNITSVSQSKHQRSICLYLLHIASCLWNFFDSENVIDVCGQMNSEVKERKEEGKREEGTVPSFGSHHPQFKGQMPEDSTEGQESFTWLPLTFSHCNYSKCSHSCRGPI